MEAPYLMANDEFGSRILILWSIDLLGMVVVTFLFCLLELYKDFLFGSQSKAFCPYSDYDFMSCECTVYTPMSEFWNLLCLN